MTNFSLNLKLTKKIVFILLILGGNLARQYGGFIRGCVQVPKLPNVTCSLLKKQDPTIKQCQLCDSDLCNTDTSAP